MPFVVVLKVTHSSSNFIYTVQPDTFRAIYCVDKCVFYIQSTVCIFIPVCLPYFIPKVQSVFMSLVPMPCLQSVFHTSILQSIFQAQTKVSIMYQSVQSTSSISVQSLVCSPYYAISSKSFFYNQFKTPGLRSQFIFDTQCVVHIFDLQSKVSILYPVHNPYYLIPSLQSVFHTVFSTKSKVNVIYCILYLVCSLTCFIPSPYFRLTPKSVWFFDNTDFQGLALDSSCSSQWIP